MAPEFSVDVFRGGFKLRNSGVTPIAAGLGVELWRRSCRVSAADGALTLRPVLHLRSGPWPLILNPGVEFPLGHDGRSFAPAVRRVRRVAERVRLGLEHSIAFGRLDRPEAPRGQAHPLFATTDVRIGDRVGLQVGIGHGPTHASDRWAGKLTLAIDV